MTRLGRTTGYGAIIDVPGVGGGVVDRLAELELPVVPYNGGEAPIDKERFVNARAEAFWTLRERFEQSEIDIDPDDDKLATQLGSIKWSKRLAAPSSSCIDSRRRIKIDGHSVRWQGKCCTDECGESRWREHHRGFDDQGVVRPTESKRRNRHLTMSTRVVDAQLCQGVGPTTGVGCAQIRRAIHCCRCVRSRSVASHGCTA